MTILNHTILEWAFALGTFLYLIYFYERVSEEPMFKPGWELIGHLMAVVFSVTYLVLLLIIGFDKKTKKVYVENNNLWN